jgi:acyl carrier protein phosphodiesterase
MVDVFFDHFLALQLDSPAAKPSLELVAARAYAALSEHPHLLHGRLREVAPCLVEYRGLEVYRVVSGVDRALRQMSRRGARRAPLAAGGAQLVAHYTGLRRDFDQFFPALADRFGAPEPPPDPRAVPAVPAVPDVRQVAQGRAGAPLP